MNLRESSCPSLLLLLVGALPVAWAIGCDSTTAPEKDAAPHEATSLDAAGDESVAIHQGEGAADGSRPHADAGNAGEGPDANQTHVDAADASTSTSAETDGADGSQEAREGNGSEHDGDSAAAAPDSSDGLDAGTMRTDVLDTGIAEMDTSDAAEIGARRCRRYMTQGTTASPGGAGTATAAFDPVSLTYTGVYSVAGQSITQSRTYANLTDYIAEPTVVGRYLWIQQVVHSSSQTQQTTSAFDGQNRLLSQALVDVTGVDATTVYSVWDSLGRPTRGAMTANPAELDCSNMPVTVTYDDAGRKRTETIHASSGSGAGCLSGAAYVNEEVYDMSGNVISTLHPSETGPTTIAITKTEEICLP